MTTVAYDGKIIASDSQMTGMWIDQVGVQKIKETENGYYAICGRLDDFDVIVDAFEHLIETGVYDKSGNKLEKLDHFVFENVDVISEVLFIPFEKYDQPLALYADEVGCLRVVKIGIPTAIGSGSPYAMGAMLAGKNAVEAVEIASELDSGTDSNVNFINIEDEHKKEKEHLELSTIYTALAKEGSYKKAAVKLGMTKDEVKRICQESLKDFD